MRGEVNPPPPPASKPNKTIKNIKYLPFQDHPMFQNPTNPIKITPPFGNLAAFDDASSCLYLWIPHSLSLHRIAIFQRDDDDDDDDQDSQILAASPIEIFVPDAKIKSDICRISLNADGSLLILWGPDSVYLMFLYEKTTCSSTSPLYGSSVSCRTSKVSSQIFSAHNNGLQVLQVTWHPFSSSHVGILSSDPVLRLFDLSLDLEQPEQEFYLEPFELGSCHNAVSIYPEHSRSEVTICGTDFLVCSRAFLEELHEDVKAIGLKSSYTNVIGNLSLALDWLESTFPGLTNQSIEEVNKLVLIAQPYAPVDASLTLQACMQIVLLSICLNLDAFLSLPILHVFYLLFML